MGILNNHYIYPHPRVPSLTVCSSEYVTHLTVLLLGASIIPEGVKGHRMCRSVCLRQRARRGTIVLVHCLSGTSGSDTPCTHLYTTYYICAPSYPDISAAASSNFTKIFTRNISGCQGSL